MDNTIITLDNFASNFPRWDPDGHDFLYALVDMGSNGIRFSISDLSPPTARLLRCVYRERAGISLFDALNGSQGPFAFPPETIKLVSQTIARFRSIAVNDFKVPVANFTVFATEAMRRARNAAAMLAAIRAAAQGVSVQILAPEVETLFGALGARSGFVDVKGLFLDLGGGSVQMTYMDTYQARHQTQALVDGESSYEIAAARAGQSLPFGAARLIRILDNAETDVRASEVSKLQLNMQSAFQDLRDRFSGLQESIQTGVDVYLCGGGFRGYGSMLMHNDPIQPYPFASIGTYTVPGDFFRRTAEMLEFNKNYDGKIFGMSKRRRTQFPAIVTVVQALDAAIPKIRSVIFCTGGNREGALFVKLPKDIRESNPLTSLDIPTPLGRYLRRDREEILQEVIDTLLAALPVTDAPTVFTLGMGELFATKIWENSGEDGASNGSSCLHDSISSHLSLPGLSHLARAVLGLTLCSRWGSSLSPRDQQLQTILRQLVDKSAPGTSFWADYVGAVAGAMALVVPTWPDNTSRVKEAIRFHAAVDDDIGQRKINLTISVSSILTTGLDLNDMRGLFKSVAKDHKDGMKISVQTQLIPGGNPV